MSKKSKKGSPRSGGKSKGSQSTGNKIGVKWLLGSALVVILLAASVFSFAEFSPAIDYNSRETIDFGQTLFVQNCMACHGEKAKGENIFNHQGGQKPDGSYFAPALNGTAHAWHHPPDMLFSIVKDGSADPKSQMKGWRGRMGDREIHSILAYVRSLWPPEISYRYRKANNLE